MSPRTAFRLVLRAIGLFYALEGIPEVVQWVLWSQQYLVLGSVGSYFPLIGGLVGICLRLGIGLHLFFGAEWLLNLAYPRGRSCDECGYALVGLPRVGICPECGQAFQPAAPSPEDHGRTSPGG